jgi:hypothetical protein
VFSKPPKRSGKNRSPRVRKSGNWGLEGWTMERESLAEMTETDTPAAQMIVKTHGTATGDLGGAVSGSILGTPEIGSGGTVIFHVQHHWVTESGDQVFFEPATATTMPLGLGLFAVLTYPLYPNGGTGKFANVNGGLINAIGEVHCDNSACSAGQTIFRYSGQVCFANAGQDH